MRRDGVGGVADEDDRRRSRGGEGVERVVEIVDVGDVRRARVFEICLRANLRFCRKSGTVWRMCKNVSSNVLI